ncbi:hypothetical protein GGX14DRAFT_406835 [Mycena pura]|uniref:SnoaL-like domain-containing protein n=1 Tax=Mycena pura TaxID=153505 RepID=A0AAD6UPC9_9AGAR|nr:hypothetical protein GGX14DRAFT_406835 [Mycena pura]
MAANIVEPTPEQFLQGNIKALYTAADSKAFEAAFDTFLPEDGHVTITLNGQSMSRAQYKKVIAGETFDEAKGTVAFTGALQTPAKADIAGTAAVSFTANITKKLLVEGKPSVTVVTSCLIVVLEDHKSKSAHGVHGGVTNHQRIVSLTQLLVEQNNQ